MATGKFHGVMTPTTPSGARTQYAALWGISLGAVEPCRRRPAPAPHPPLVVVFLNGPPPGVLAPPPAVMDTRRPPRSPAGTPARPDSPPPRTCSAESTS